MGPLIYIKAVVSVSECNQQKSYKKLYLLSQRSFGSSATSNILYIRVPLKKKKKYS